MSLQQQHIKREDQKNEKEVTSCERNSRRDGARGHKGEREKVLQRESPIKVTQMPQGWQTTALTTIATMMVLIQ